jgi:hypothetical protein
MLDTIQLIIRNDSPEQAIVNITVQFRRDPYDPTDPTAEQIVKCAYLGKLQTSAQLGTMYKKSVTERYVMTCIYAEWAKQ